MLRGAHGDGRQKRMEISNIVEMIKEAEAEEARTGDLVHLLQAIAERRGCNPNPSELDDAAQFVAEYINQVPVYMEEALLTARESGIEPEMIRVLQAAETYWADPHDVIPDRMGLVGIMDDAYTSMCLLERMSDRLKEKTGQSLFTQDLKPANSAIRVIIGEPYATQLDMYVSNHAVGSLNRRVTWSVESQFCAHFHRDQRVAFDVKQLLTVSPPARLKAADLRHLPLASALGEPRTKPSKEPDSFDQWRHIGRRVRIFGRSSVELPRRWCCLFNA